MVIKAVIFDCDGVLVDSEPVSCLASALALTEKGFKTNVEEIKAKMIGKSVKEMLGYFEARDGIHADLNELNQAIEKHYFRLAESLKPMPGIDGLLEQLFNRGIPLAVASSGSYQKIAFSLEKTNLRKYFTVICSTVDVPKGKPEPDLFLYAAQKLGFRPENCMVVEDSIYGVSAGKKAGMYTLGYASSFPREILTQTGADAVIEDYQEFKMNIFQ